MEMYLVESHSLTHQGPGDERKMTSHREEESLSRHMLESCTLLHSGSRQTELRVQQCASMFCMFGHEVEKLGRLPSATSERLLFLTSANAFEIRHCEFCMCV